MALLGISPQYANSGEVQLPDYEGFWNLGGERDTTVYSGIRFGSDGKIYRATIAGNWQWTGRSWLLDGAASGYYLVRTVVSGSALASDGGTLQQMNTNLDYYITTVLRQKRTTLEFKISDDTAGSNILTTNSYQLDCEREIDFEQGEPFERPNWVAY